MDGRVGEEMRVRMRVERVILKLRSICGVL